MLLSTNKYQFCFYITISNLDVAIFLPCGVLTDNTSSAITASGNQ